MKDAGMFTQAVRHAFWTGGVRDAAQPKQEELSRAVFIDFWASARDVGLMVVLGVAALYLAGKVHPSLPLDLGKLCSVLGAWLSGWGAWLALKDGRPSWGGKRADELARAGLFRLLFAPGVLLSAFGAGWWG